MTLRGKDYCNCDHAHFLRDAIIAAHAVAIVDPEAASKILCDVLLKDHEACIDLWGNIQNEGAK
jgi:hypothetical protein